jgi:hypothetical protein
VAELHGRRELCLLPEFGEYGACYGVRRQVTRGFNPETPNANAFGIKLFQPVPSGIDINNTTSGKNHGANIGGGSNLRAVIDDNIPVDVSDDVTWVRGKHQFAFGGALVRTQLNVNNGYQGQWPIYLQRHLQWDRQAR